MHLPAPRKGAPNAQNEPSPPRTRIGPQASVAELQYIGPPPMRNGMRLRIPKLNYARRSAHVSLVKSGIEGKGVSLHRGKRQMSSVLF